MTMKVRKDGQIMDNNTIMAIFFIGLIGYGGMWLMKH